MKEFKRQIDDRWCFRDADVKEFTHCYHVYPAMMIPQIARCLISEFHPSGKLDVIFDPYVGSGTTLVEARLAGINAIGTDLNPLARLLSQVKTTRYDVSSIENQWYDIQSYLLFFDDSKVRNTSYDFISNHTYWYSNTVLNKLSYLSQLIEDLCVDADFFNVALAELVREVSYTRNGEFKRFRMKEDSKKTFNPDVFALFERKIRRNISGLKQFYAATDDTTMASVYGFNTSEGIPSGVIPKGEVDMIVTSPPYGDSRTTVAYGQFSRWANEWFRYSDAASLDNKLMGGGKTDRIVFSSECIKDELQDIKMREEKRYWEVISFLNDYSLSIKNVAGTVRSGGVVAYVVGDRRVKNVQISLDYFTAEMFTSVGYDHITTIVREIPNKRMPSKSSPSNKVGDNVSTMSHEYIVILRKR